MHTSAAFRWKLTCTPRSRIASRKKPLSGPHDLTVAACDEPYVYVESMGKKVVYLARDESGRDELERMRLKPMIATLLGIPERGYWQAYPGDLELSQLISRWRQTCQT